MQGRWEDNFTGTHTHTHTHTQNSLHLHTISGAVVEDVLKELQTFGIQEGIAGAIKHKDDTVRHLIEAPLPEEPPRHPPLLGEEGGGGQPCTITVHPSEGELMNGSLMSIVLLE